MYAPTQQQIKPLLEKGNVIPIIIEVANDLLTPVSVYLKLTNSNYKHSFLFESVAGGQKIGRYSFIGSAPYKVLSIGDKQEISGDPLVVLEKELENIRYVSSDPNLQFTGGAIGYLSYDCIRFFEPKTAREHLKDTLEIPDAIFMFCDTIVIFDHLHHVMKVVSHFKCLHKHPMTLTDEEIEKEYTRVTTEINSVVALLSSEHTPLPPQPPILLNQEPISNVGKEGYEAFVNVLKTHIVEGDIIQAVPSQRVAKRTTLHPFNAYRNLRSLNPSPYMFYVDLGDFQLVGASPEMLVKVEDRKVFTHPIAGTRKRGKNEVEDDKLASNLLSDLKERSEHIMLVDLGRNDMNRVCKPETVVLDSLMHIERYSHVMHIVSHVSGTLRDDKTGFDAFRSIFPAGTVSGAPKVRAMELIYELEKEKRGIYAGAVGYFSYSGSIDTCIAIRTMLFKDSRVYLQAGGGIVYDSVAQDEYEETLNKLKSNVTAIENAEKFQYESMKIGEKGLLFHPLLEREEED